MTIKTIPTHAVRVRQFFYGPRHTQTRHMTADEILSDLEMTLGTASRADVRGAYRLADAAGIIQAHDMVRLMGLGYPTRHTTCSLRQALRWLGCRDRDGVPHA